MESAFGIDHGEVEKAFRRKKPQPVPANYEPMGRKLKRAGNKVGDAHISLKGIGGGAGTAAQKVGRGFSTRPGLTGAAIVGGGGYGAYKLSQKDKRKKKG